MFVCGERRGEREEEKADFCDLHFCGEMNVFLCEREREKRHLTLEQQQPPPTTQDENKTHVVLLAVFDSYFGVYVHLAATPLFSGVKEEVFLEYFSSSAVSHRRLSCCWRHFFFFIPSLRLCRLSCLFSGIFLVYVHLKKFSVSVFFSLSRVVQRAQRRERRPL